VKKLRILVLMHADTDPPPSLDGVSDEEMLDWKGEYDVMVTLRDLGHTVVRVGLDDDLGVLRAAIDEVKPHIAFNLLEEFHGLARFDQHVVSYLELMRVPYTGCNPRGLTVARDKALTKKILAYHRIAVPRFAVFPRGRKIRKPASLPFPLFVKSLDEEASVGVSQASIVRDEESLRERVELIHRAVPSDAIAEEYIEGRELYVGITGNERVATYPPWELRFDNLPEGAPRIATRKVKWDTKYQKKVGFHPQRAVDLPEPVARSIPGLSRRIYRLLYLSGYARLDLRLREDGRLFLLEANPNPYIAYGDEFAEGAEAAGVGYEELISRILRLGLAYRRRTGPA
jgi:D-alanine-D-alanine ligase